MVKGLSPLVAALRLMARSGRVCKHMHRLPAQDCSDNAFLAAGQWIVDHSDFVLLAWNGYPAAGRGGTADTASYARFVGCPFIHVHTRLHTTKLYGELPSEPRETRAVTSREFAVEKQTVYQGSVLTVNRYHMRMPNGRCHPELCVKKSLPQEEGSRG